MTTITIDRVRLRSRAAAAALAALLGAAGLCAGTGVRAADSVIITEADCARLPYHSPQPGVEYQPGVDVRGRTVAPADLPDTPKLEFPKRLRVRVLIELVRRYGLPANSALYKLGDMPIGTVRIRVKDGRAWYNGQPLSARETDAIARLCADMKAGRVR
ncbi:MAG: hypothetical protein R3229_15870 [Alphaproteobacteria bacterium]|nr:hypothetical protein [Alphaproteobacteria bacterium]